MTERDAIERALGDALRDRTMPGDDARLRLLVDRVVDGSIVAPVHAYGRALPVATGVGLAVGGALLAAMLLHRSPPPPVTPVEAPTVVMAVEAPAPTQLAKAADKLAEPTLEATASSAPVHHEATAAQLFGRANDARRKGRDAEATSTYRALQQLFPTSPEAVASHMSLGRLLLDGHHDPGSALAEFDRYLANGSHSELREEALIGRALALGQLQRAEEERRAWQTLLREYPSSMYADQARDRITTLGR